LGLKEIKEKVMAGEQTILDRVKAEATVIESVRVLVQSLKDNASDPAKVAEIISALDANDAALAVVAGTPAE
jgi:esterase/lipase